MDLNEKRQLLSSYQRTILACNAGLKTERKPEVREMLIIKRNDSSMAMYALKSVGGKVCY